MTPFGAIPQQHMPILREDDIIANDVQIGNGGHDFGVRIRIVERRYMFPYQKILIQNPKSLVMDSSRYQIQILRWCLAICAQETTKQ